MLTVKLFRDYQMPCEYREPFIIRGYRPCRCSLITCLASAFQRTNETVNFWTHFLPLLPFVYLAVYHIRDAVATQDPYVWPMVIYLVSSCLYLFWSSIAHLLNSMSFGARQLLFFFDYSGVSIYSLGCCIAYFVYVFPPGLLLSSLYHAYLPVAVVTAVASTALSCSSRFATSDILRNYGRLPAFMIPYVWCSLPLCYRVLACESSGCSSPAWSYHVAQFFFVFLSAVFYATRFPEMVAPGRFDVIGHSHQFFHIAGSTATYLQYLALHEDMVERRSELVEAVGTPRFASTFAVGLSVLVANVVVSCWLWHRYIIKGKADAHIMNNNHIACD